MIAVTRKSALQAISVYEKHVADIAQEWDKLQSTCFTKVFGNEAERNKVKEKLQPVILENLYKEPDDELSRI